MFRGLNYGQEENSDGSVVTGEYRVLLPDGRTQIVRYKKTFLQYFRTFILRDLYNFRYRADHESGYTAEVTYEGEARPYVAPPKPAYSAALI